MLGAGLAVAVMVPGGLGWHWYLGLSTIPLFIVVFLFVVSCQLDFSVYLKDHFVVHSRVSTILYCERKVC